MAPRSILILGLCLLTLFSNVVAQNPQCTMAPSPTLTKFLDPLPSPSVIPAYNGELTLGVYKITQKLHSELNATTLYAYGTSVTTASYPGPTLVAKRGIPTTIWWENHIHDHDHILPVDKNIHWANPKYGYVPIIPHLHGAETHSSSDGNPDSWFTATGEYGKSWNPQPFRYNNTQFPTLLWYHDHALGMTRLNVYAGMAGAYLLTWPEVETYLNLPSGEFMVPLIVQDKQFYANGSLNFPYPWCPEFFGDAILVNGKAWPYLIVQATQYRFRVLGGANARFFNLTFSNNMTFLKIGTDGGFLSSPLNVSSVLLSPGQRADIIVDFSSLKNGTEIYLNNTAQNPFPTGSLPSNGTRVIMKFIVNSTVLTNPHHNAKIPDKFPDIFGHRRGSLSAALKRRFNLSEVTDSANNVLRILINGLMWNDTVTETPFEGSTELWEMINLTPDAHPMHLHLVQFHCLTRQPFNKTEYSNGICSLNVEYNTTGSCYTGYATPCGPDEQGWKDTVVAYPDEVTTFSITFTSQDGSSFPFDPTTGPGYPWHCHIVDHEDNDMMRPFVVQKYLPPRLYADA